MNPVSKVVDQTFEWSQDPYSIWNGDPKMTVCLRLVSLWPILSVFFGVFFVIDAAVGGTSWLWMVWLASTGAATWMVPSIPKAHPLYGMNNDPTYLKKTSDRYFLGTTTSSFDLMRKYLELDKKDKALFPPDVLSALKNPDLGNSDRTKINESIHNTLEQLKDRDKARAEISRSTGKTKANFDGLLAALEQAESDATVEAKVYTEGAQKVKELEA